MWYWASLAPTVSVVGSTTYVYKYFILSKSLKSQAEQARAIARPCSARRFLTYCILVPLNHHSRFNHHLYKIQINHHFFAQKVHFLGLFGANFGTSKPWFFYRTPAGFIGADMFSKQADGQNSYEIEFPPKNHRKFDICSSHVRVFQNSQMGKSTKLSSPQKSTKKIKVPKL